MTRATRIFLLTALLLALLMPTSASAAGSRAAQRSGRLSSLESDVLSSLNATRVARGLVPLRISAGLSSAARQHSQEMARLGYFAHSSANGGSFEARIARSYPFGAAFRRWAVGENLVWEAPDLAASEALRLWMQSPEHRKNILDPTWTEIGISAVHAAAAPGVYGGGDVTVITTDFGSRN
ncbi:MAG: CAP domain-containing protein [Gaiellaceae bacterium]